MDQVVVYGEFFNATDHLRRLDGYETTVGVVKGLVAEEDQLYWSDEFLGVEGPPGPTGPAGPTGPPGADGEDGEDGDTVDEGYAIDLTVGPPRVISFDPTEITGFAAAFQFFRHLAADNDPNEPHWKTIGGFSAGASQMLWHQSDAWTFQTVTGYDDTSAKQLLGHIDGAWQWKTLVDWLKELPNYSAGSDQIMGHAAGGDPEWKTLTSKVINSPTAASLNLDADSLDLDINYTPVTVKLWPAASDGAGADFTDTVSVTECA
jgi:hypothetical protein